MPKKTILTCLSCEYEWDMNPDTYQDDSELKCRCGNTLVILLVFDFGTLVLGPADKLLLTAVREAISEVNTIMRLSMISYLN